MPSPFEAELEKITLEYADAVSRAKHDDASDVLSQAQASALQARCVAAVERAAGRTSVYFERVSAPLKAGHSWYQLPKQIGAVASLLHDLRSGFVRTFGEVLHAEIFADYLEMAAHLVSQGYKDAAAVLAGSTLEAHLRQMCNKHGVATDVSGKPKKADVLNAELAAAGAYSKLDQKNVTAWLGLRNHAAHGSYSEYDKNQVALLIDAVRDFITRNPA